jgi:hypothetical protein
VADRAPMTRREAKRRAVGEIFHRREHVRAKRPLGMGDDHWCVEQRHKLAAHVDLAGLAADENGNRRARGPAHDFAGLGGGQWHDVQRRVDGRRGRSVGLATAAPSRRTTISGDAALSPLAEPAAGSAGFTISTASFVSEARSAANGASIAPRSIPPAGTEASDRAEASVVLLLSTVSAVFTLSTAPGAAAIGTGAGGLSMCTNRCGSAKSRGISSGRAMMTRAPRLGRSHSREANSCDMRMQPCEAGWPRFWPWCKATPDQVMRCM